MYPPKFDYHRAGSVAEALTLLKENPGAKLLAGGHSLIPVMKLRLSDPGVLIDIGRIDGIKGIRHDGGNVHIGALTTHSMIEHGDGLPGALTEAASYIGDPAVRNRGTVGGNVAHADPASDLPTVFVCLGATMHMQGDGGTRSVAAADFFTDLFETAMGEDELLIGVSFAAEGAGSGSAYEKLFNPASRYAMVGAAVQVTMDGDTCTAASVAVGGLTPSATASPSVAAALTGQTLDDATINAAAAKVTDDIDADFVLGDIHASAEYRLGVVGAIVARAIRRAVARAGA